jgi:uncharacterized RDD family membrane protein YckC
MEKNNLSEPQNGSDLLGQEVYDNPYIQYNPADKMQRFVNLLIDNLFLRFGLSYVTGYAVVMILMEIAPDFLYEATAGFSFEFLLLSYLMGVVNYIVYYTLSEKLFKGYTLGKLITGTRAIREDGGELTFKDALLRSLSRIVPFEAFSGLGDVPWHDRWTKTMVIKAR